MSSMPWMLFARLILILFLTTTTALAHKNAPIRSWQEGTLLDLKVSKDLIRYDYTNTTTANTNRNYTNANTFSSGSAQPVYRTYVTVRIDDDDRFYIAQQDLRFPWSKAPNLVINGPVRFTLDRGKLIVLDNDGKEHGMKVMQQVLKQNNYQSRNRN